MKLGDLFLRRRSANFARTFESPQGQRTLADILAFCDDPRLYSPNPFEMAQAAGRLQVRQHLLKVMQYDEERTRVLLADETTLRAREVA